MGVVNFLSTQMTAMSGTATPYFETGEAYGRVRVMKFDLTAGSAGDANSTFELIRLPAGKVTVLGSGSVIKCSAFGTARTLDVGYGAYRQPLATSNTAADEDGLHSAADVSSATSFAPHDKLATGSISFDSVTGVTITAKCEAAAVPNGATLKGYFLIVVD